MNGKTELENEIKNTADATLKIKSGRVIFTKEMPALFIAVISKCSAILPIVIIEDNNIARGSARGMVFNEKKKNNFSKGAVPMSLPKKT